ncbi:hypothetical protein FACS189426_24080 [Bacteroidia bacterium]|nr:hypothetical protein FACS189426_24080 [Bacteroidia bacterium]
MIKESYKQQVSLLLDIMPIIANLSSITFPDVKRADEELKLFCLRDNAVVKIEVNQINRGLIADTRVLTLSKKAQDYFDTYCKATVVSQGQLWGGKINAALDRQHPRDLFDMRNFYQNHTLTDEIKRGFLYFLLCSKRPIHEVLQPKNIDHAKVLFTSRMIEPASGNYEKGDIKSPMHPSGSPDLSFPKFERIQSPALLI